MSTGPLFYSSFISFLFYSPLWTFQNFTVFFQPPASFFPTDTVSPALFGAETQSGSAAAASQLYDWPRGRLGKLRLPGLSCCVSDCSLHTTHIPQGTWPQLSIVISAPLAPFEPEDHSRLPWLWNSEPLGVQLTLTARLLLSPAASFFLGCQCPNIGPSPHCTNPGLLQGKGQMKMVLFPTLP